MTRNPIAVLIQLAGLKVDQARTDHSRAQAAVCHICQSIELMHGRIANEQGHARSLSGPSSVLAAQGIEALYRSLDEQDKIRAGLEAKAALTHQQLNQAILAEERFAVHQSRVRQQKDQIRQRREIARQEDLYLARSRGLAGGRGDPS